MKLKSKKSALVLSFVSVMLCVAMLVGSTFAWFTDTASANVNRIQSGNLDVDIVDASGASLEGKTLSFRNVDKSADILWEPGAKFALDSFRIVNDGNLALKYTVTVNGLTGDAKLLEVIDFIAEVGGVETKLENLKGTLLPVGATPTDGENVDVGATKEITIYGKMQETAGNEYKNLSIDGISITVNATQASYENDSIGNTYDEKADMTPDNLDKMVSANVTETVTAGEKTTFANADSTVTLTAPADSLTAGEYTLTVTPTTTADISNIEIDDGQAAKTYEIKLADENGDPVQTTEDKKFTVTLFVGKNLTGVKVYHDTEEITGAQYESDTGVVTFTTTSFSPYTVVHDSAVVVTTAEELINAFKNALKGEDLKVSLKSDVEISNNALSVVNETQTGVGVGVGNITIDANGHTIKTTNSGTRCVKIECADTARKITIRNAKIVSESTVGNTSENRGLQLFSVSNATIELVDCTIEMKSKNYSYPVKIAGTSENLTLNLTRCTLTGANCIESFGKNCTVNITDCVFNSNYAPHATYCGNGIQDKNGTNNTYNIKNTTFNGTNAQPWQTNDTTTINDLGGNVDNTTRTTE